MLFVAGFSFVEFVVDVVENIEDVVVCAGGLVVGSVTVGFVVAGNKVLVGVVVVGGNVFAIDDCVDVAVENGNNGIGVDEVCDDDDDGGGGCCNC